MFGLEKIQTLNRLEVLVYHYVLGHLHQVLQRTVRQLATSCHASTSTTLRFCNKIGYAGLSELKHTVKEEAKQARTFENFYGVTVHVDAFLKRLNQKTYCEMLRPAVQMIVQTHHATFIGIDTNGILDSYGSRYFANLNISSYSIANPFMPIPRREFENTLALILSVSGETNEMIRQMTDFKTAGAKALGITSNQHSTVARLADHSISYYTSDERSPFADKSVNTTTQTPVITLIGLLARQASQLLKELGETFS